MSVKKQEQMTCVSMKQHQQRRLFFSAREHFFFYSKTQLTAKIRLYPINNTDILSYISLSLHPLPHLQSLSQKIHHHTMYCDCNCTASYQLKRKLSPQFLAAVAAYVLESACFCTSQ